ncbi:MAG: hypothetical protein P0121_08410 [Nitrospira sp.]|nr:hypothetical protein [Nitrospira sp.]
MTGLTPDNWEKTISEAWQAVRDRIEVRRDLDFSHEHTLQFHLAWEIARLLRFSPSLQVRFEVRTVAPKPRGAIFTDIVFWTDPEFRIAVELKAPARSDEGSNSAMTHGRMAFYKDLDRLRCVLGVPELKIRRGIFLAVVNELGYVTKRKQYKNLVYDTFDGTTIEAGTTLPVTEGRNGCPYPLQMPEHSVSWRWECTRRDGAVIPATGNRHYWLTPIPVFPKSTMA